MRAPRSWMALPTAVKQISSYEKTRNIFLHFLSLPVSPPIKAFPAELLDFRNGSTVWAARCNSSQSSEEMNGLWNEYYKTRPIHHFSDFSFPLDSH